MRSMCRVSNKINNYDLKKWIREIEELREILKRIGIF